MPLPKGYISYNQIKTYRNCPKQYYFSYLENIRTPVNDKIFLGVIFHEVADFCLKRKTENIKTSVDQAKEYFTEKFDKISKESEIIWNDNKEKTRNRGLAFVNYFAREIAPRIHPLMTEKELVCELPDSGVKLRGIIDLVEEDFSITDFKTTTAKWSKDRVKKSYLQMYIYKFLFEENMGGSIGELKFKILYSKNSSNIKHQEHSITSNKDYFVKMFEIINFVIENIEQGYFYKNESFVCNFCSYKDICKKTSS